MKDRLILLVLAVSFVGLAIETRATHHSVLEAHPQAWIPIIYAAAAAVACLAGMGIQGKGRIVLSVILALGPIVGAVGAWFHYEKSPGTLAVVVREGVPAGEKLMKEPGEYPEDDAPPLMAPLSYAGMSLIGLVTLAMGQGVKSTRKRTP